MRPHGACGSRLRVCFRYFNSYRGITQLTKLLLCVGFLAQALMCVAVIGAVDYYFIQMP